MKKKHLFLLPAVTLAGLTSASAQTEVDKSAANFKEGKLSDYTELLEKAIKSSAGKDLPEGFDSAKLLEVAGIDSAATYQQSSTPEGTEWINRFQLNNGGNHKGVFKLLTDSKYQDLSVQHMSPAGTDLAMQISFNGSTLEGLIESFMNTGSAPDADKAKFKESMASPVPMMEMTTSELLKKLDMRLNFALDLDKAEQLPTPFGAFDKPNLVIRFDGISWIWDKIGAQMIGQTGLPFQKTEENGVTTFSLPPEMAANFMGYSPIIKADSAKNQLWIASTPEFLTKSSNGQNSLANSPEFKATMQGLPQKGFSYAYLSKDGADFAAKFLNTMKEKGAFNSADEYTKNQMDQALVQLAKVKNGAAQVATTNATGIFTAERAVQNIDQKMADAVKAFEQMKKQAAEAEKPAEKAEPKKEEAPKAADKAA